MEERSSRAKYEAPRIISMEEIGSSIGGPSDPSCTPGDSAYTCKAGDGGTIPSGCSSGPAF